ncbi:hypothetical protein RB195_014650 [Necator americanus]|uniref:Uncharacterized protein n=1 Tax=Necator americanus TaxID=51031 RepID=A0ABR1E131_NECAM
MATSLKIRKGVVTRQFNVLAYALKNYASLGETEISAVEGDFAAKMCEIDSALVYIRTVQTSLQKAIYAFAETVDSIEMPPGGEEEKRVSEHIEKINTLLSETETFLARLLVQKHILTTKMRTQTGVQVYPDPGVQNQETPVGRVELPRLPIPEFNGKSWQWDNFWELHSLPLSNLQKFNYLLRALKGEARQSAERFQVTASNYLLVLEHLREKYGNTSAIITSLHERLETWTARSTDLQDQCNLFDKISSLTKQLESKGENLDSSWLLSKILAKFRQDIQRRVLEKKVSLPAEQVLNLKTQMETLETVIRQEREIERNLPVRTEQKNVPSKLKPNPWQDRKRMPYCFYCESKEHWPTSCTKLKLPKERIDFLKKMQRRLGCGSKFHNTPEWKSRGCAHCGKKHHTSTCFKSTPSSIPENSRNAATKKNEKIQKTT